MGKFAIVFPGQGSQSIGMLADLAKSFSVIQHTFEEAADVLGIDLWKMAQQGSVETLNSTENTQPAMLCAGISVWRVWQAQGGDIPALMAGHSLGEYTALTASGVLTFTDAIQLVAERGRLMQSAVPQGTGALAAILGLSDDEVEKMVADAEANAEADKQFEELITARNQGDAIVHATKKTLEEAGDKATAEEKTAIEAAISDLEAALKTDDKADIEEKTKALTEASSSLAQKMYAEQAAAGAEAGADESTNDNASKDDDVVDAEFEEVKDDKK